MSKQKDEASGREIMAEEGGLVSLAKEYAEWIAENRDKILDVMREAGKPLNTKEIDEKLFEKFLDEILAPLIQEGVVEIRYERGEKRVNLTELGFKELKKWRKNKKRAAQPR